MPLKTITAQTFVVTVPATATTPETEIARIVCSEENRQLLVRLNPKVFSHRQLLQGIPLSPYTAAYLGDALKQAAEITNKAWGQ